jgi:hypothetical protein
MWEVIQYPAVYYGKHCLSLLYQPDDDRWIGIDVNSRHCSVSEFIAPLQRTPFGSIELWAWNLSHYAIGWTLRCQGAVSQKRDLISSTEVAVRRIAFVFLVGRPGHCVVAIHVRGSLWPLLSSVRGRDLWGGGVFRPWDYAWEEESMSLLPVGRLIWV